MKFYKLDNIKKIFYELSSFKIFILSFLICLLFYFLEGVIGIDRFYHPDSTHYLSKYKTYQLNSILNLKDLTSAGYYILAQIFNYNYFLLILLNFVFYALTNVLIYEKIFKKYFNVLNYTKLIILFYILFLDPYRLHLACHILKETFLIFFLIMIILSNIKIVKLLFIPFLELFRGNSWIYILIFLNFSHIKKIMTTKNIYIISILFILIIIIIYLLHHNFYDLTKIAYDYIINKIQWLDNKTMPIRPYDQVYQFKDFNFPVGFILKNILWPILMVSGLFIFFVSSSLFKFLGIIILLNNLLIYVITKKTFINLGLIIVLVLISAYTSSFTSMFRYSYIAIYSTVIYFLFNLSLKYNDK